jgi:hypothetical protein
MTGSETVKVELEIPSGLLNAIRWYCRYTRFHPEGVAENEAVNTFMVYMLRQQIEGEQGHPQLAIDHLRRTLEEEFNIS